MTIARWRARWLPSLASRTVGGTWVPHPWMRLSPSSWQMLLTHGQAAWCWTHLSAVVPSSLLAPSWAPDAWARTFADTFLRGLLTGETRQRLRKDVPLLWCACCFLLLGGLLDQLIDCASPSHSYHLNTPPYSCPSSPRASCTMTRSSRPCDDCLPSGAALARMLGVPWTRTSRSMVYARRWVSCKRQRSQAVLSGTSGPFLMPSLPTPLTASEHVSMVALLPSPFPPRRFPHPQLGRGKQPALLLPAAARAAWKA